MLKILVLSALYFVYCTNGATFENVDGALTERQHIGFGVRNPIFPLTKEFSIKSDDSLLPYVKDEDTLTVIEISYQNVPKLPKDSIKDLEKITGLGITASGLEEIEPGTFNNVPQLIDVNLSNNKLTMIKNGVFSGLQIRILTLDNNNITIIEDKAFTNMKLTHIYMQNNGISIWNGGWFDGSPVSGIFMGKNLIQELPENSFKFIVNEKEEEPVVRIADAPSNRTIVILYFHDNEIKTIHSGAFNGVGKIEELDLKDNQIKELAPDTFNGITTISTLRLNNNKLAKISADAFGNTRVISADLDNNELEDFPFSLLKSKQVFYVLMKDNPLKCSFIKELDNWKSNSTGEYDRSEYEFPLGHEYEDIEDKNCV